MPTPLHYYKLPESKDHAPLVKLPIVSVIIVNYNYASFLTQCINSVIEQTYKNIELIIVDNCSTDNSKALLLTLQKTHPDVEIIWRSENGGQSCGCIDGFRASKGEYVIFLDADDYLLDTAIEAHIWTHLSSRIPVGVTSVDMLQVVEDRLVVSTRQEFSAYVCAAQRRGDTTPTRRLSLIDEARFPATAADPTIASEVYFVPPATADWVWSPTSGNCFRRDAVALFIDNDGLPGSRIETDTYLVMGISCLTGSILIDRPLAVYRMHGRNLWARHPQLNRIVAWNPDDGMATESGQTGRKLVLAQYIQEIEIFVRKSPSPVFVAKAMEEIGFHISCHGTRFYLSRLATRNFRKLARALGTLRFMRLLCVWYIRRI